MRSMNTIIPPKNTDEKIAREVSDVASGLMTANGTVSTPGIGGLLKPSAASLAGTSQSTRYACSSRLMLSNTTTRLTEITW